jgi:adenylate cyclase
LERRLTAILVADVVDYSRLMGEDEMRTLAAIAELRRELFEPIVANRGGTVIKRMGDGWIVEYPNIADATAGAIEIQEWLSDHEVIQLRIGVHIGDVTFQDDDIYGDGINVAARLEALAEPGQVLISDTAHQSLDGKAVENFAGGEPHQLKNIARPVAVWRWPPTEAKATAIQGVDKSEPSSLADKPSIAVLPFNDLSNDPENETIADGLSEDIITALSRNRSYHVVARNSSFAYKGTSPDIRDVARQLGVRYVLEGSVRSSGGRVRITAQLIDAESGNHVWADRYDRSYDDLFALQDEICHRIVSLLGELVWQDVARKIGKMAPEDYGPYENGMAGAELLHRLEPRMVHQSEDYFLKSLAQDPDFSLAHSALVLAYMAEWYFWDVGERDLLALAEEHTSRTLSLAPDDALTYRALCRLALAKGAFEEARRHAERGLKINPDDGDIIIVVGVYETFAGDATKAVRLFNEVIEIHSETPHSADIVRFWKALAEFVLDDAVGAKATVREISGMTYLSNLMLAASHGALGEIEAANAAISAVLEEIPGLTLSKLGVLKCFRNPEVAERLADGWRAAGLPE